MTSFPPLAPVWTAFPSSDYYAPTATPRGIGSFPHSLLCGTLRLPYHPVGSFPCSAYWTAARRCRWQLPRHPIPTLCGVPERKEDIARLTSFSRTRRALLTAIGLNTPCCLMLSLSAVLLSKVGQGKRSPKDAICFSWIHHVVFSPNTASWRLPAKETELLPSPRLRTGREGFPSSSSSME